MASVTACYPTTRSPFATRARTGWSRSARRTAAHTIQRFGRYRQVEPTVVVEVAFDVIVRSTRHQSGFSLRFPRIAHLRADKSVDEIDTVDTVRALYEGLQQGAEQLVTASARK